MLLCLAWLHRKKVKVLVTQLCDSLWPHDCSPPGSSVPGILQAKNTGVGAILFSRRSSRPRDQTQVSCTAGRLFIIWDTGEAPAWIP